VRPGIPLRQPDLERHAVLEHAVHRRAELLHLVAVLGGIRRLVRPEVARAQAAGVREPVQRRQVQRRRVHQDEVAGARGVDAVEGGEDAVDVVGDGLAVQRAGREQRVVAQVVRADPHAVDGIVGLAVREECVGVRGGVDEGGVGLVGGHLVAEHVGEGAIDGREVAVDHLVCADGAGDGVVEERGAAVDGHPARPGDAAAGSGGAAGEQSSWWWSLTTVLNEVTKARLISVAGIRRVSS